MAGVRLYKPTTPGRRGGSVSDFSDITRSTPERSLLEPIKKKGGRNHHGRTTVRFRGGGHKRRYRRIDFKRDKFNVPAKVFSVEYDPNRTARIALLHYADGEKRYILAPRGIEVGSVVQSGDQTEPEVGNSMPLANIPLGLQLHNIELQPGKGGQIARAAGTYAQLVGRDQVNAILRLNSGEQRVVAGKCMATIGAVSNPDHSNISLGKAGRSRWMGKRPSVRGVAMNPVDHPHGGGEGRSSGGRHPVTPWGVPTKGKRTRSNKSTDKFILRSRHARKGR